MPPKPEAKPEVPTPAKEDEPKADADEDDDIVIPTGGVDWSLNQDKGSGNQFWWNKTYSISIWKSSMKSLDKTSLPKITDDMVWKAFLQYQAGAVYRLCAICDGPEGNEDMKICCYCGHTVHVKTCSNVAEAEQIAWKPSNHGFEKHLCVCFACDDVKGKPKPEIKREPENARRACLRALSIESEYPRPLAVKLHRLKEQICGKNVGPLSPADDAKMMKKVQSAVAEYYQPNDSSDYLKREKIKSKCDSWGVVAASDIPKYTVIGVYPGYEDPLSGEHAKCGRPGPKYSLVDLNCADYFNEVFAEFGMCFTPFINEPNPDQFSNTAWIQETTRPEGRLSVMTTRDIKAGEEVLIGYGPLYPRTYPYNYDAYAYHAVEGFSDPPCFALWHWPTLEEKDATFVAYVGYDKDTDSYSYWQTEDEAAKDKASGGEKSPKKE